jgi:hypothetical protein
LFGTSGGHGNGHFAACHFAGKLHGALAQKVAEQSTEELRASIVGEADDPGPNGAEPVRA